MKGLIKLVCQLSPSRALILFVLFCACCLSSCAAGEVAESDIRIDAGRATSDIQMMSEDTSTPPTVPPLDATSVDTPLPFLPDAIVGNDRLSTVTMTLDGGQSTFDAAPSDVLIFLADASDTFFVDTISNAFDTTPVSLPDAAIIDRPVPTLPDVTSPPDVRPVMDVMPRVVEICNGRDDDGNGFVDEIFECSVGRRGSTCVTVCGANGYQFCSAMCRWDPVCQSYPEDCHDTIDNDCNGRIDCADGACTSDPGCRPPPPPVVDAGTIPVDASMVAIDAARTDGCHDLVVRLDRSRLPTCPSGWVAILYDSEGHPHESAPGGALTFTICGRLRGVLILSTRCGGDYLLDWPGSVGRPANSGGVASITLDGNELADGEALLCLDHFSPTPGIRPAIPLEPFFYGRCP